MAVPLLVKKIVDLAAKLRDPLSNAMDNAKATNGK